MATGKDKPTRSRNPGDAEQVAAWMDALDHSLKPGIEGLREIIKSADPRIAERIKWNAPSYHLDGVDLVTFGPRRGERILLVLHHPAIVHVRSNILEGDYKDRRLVAFDGMEEIDAKRPELIRCIQALAASLGPGQK